FSQNMTLALSSGEQIDVMGSLMANYTSLVTQGYLLDLEKDDLIGTYGKGIVDAVGQEYIDACRVGGILYGLPNNRDMAVGRFCASISTECLEGIGYTPKEALYDRVRITPEEFDEILAKIHDKYPDKETLRVGLVSYMQCNTADFIGGNAFGVLLDYGKTLKVENTFETQEYKDWCKKVYGYNQKGYINPDIATDTTDVYSLLGAGRVAGFLEQGKPGIQMQDVAGSGIPMTVFQMKDDFVSSSAVAGFPWVVPYTTADSVATMKFLNEIYTSEELTNLFVYGIEGKHYIVKDDGLAAYAEGVNAMNVGFSTISWAAPNQFLAHVWEGNSPNLWNELREFNNNAAKSAALGFTFDPTPIATEMTAVQNTYDEYQKSIEYGFVDPETAIPEMNAKMLSAGLQKIIDEKQKQLDEWAALSA
ncbi:MAG: ABC transporter substrate-binding protein, partial [Clostridiales bacterium]|nr:ABC transporter substrate-binding protein [Clostridiales bacterium]